MSDSFETILSEHASDISQIFGSVIQEDEEKAMSITSLIEAESILRGETNEKLFALIFNRITNGEITGDADDFHNIAIDYSRNNQPVRAMQICQTGIKIWQDSIDLNADAVSYALDSGDLAEASKQVEALLRNCSDRRKWNWRGFSFLSDYYTRTHPKGYEQLLDSLILDYKKYLPHEEKAYLCDANRHITEGRYDEAIKTLEAAVMGLNAPQCALKLADLYFERGRYEDVVRTATLGIAYAAEPQPSIRAAYLLFIRALSKDALYLKAGRTSQEEAKQIIKEYKLAKKYISLRETRIVDLRIDILSTYASLDSEDVE